MVSTDPHATSHKENCFKESRVNTLFHKEPYSIYFILRSFSKVLYIHENSIIFIALKKVQLLEYCSAIKKDECLPFKTTWMDLESIILIEISQTEKDK